MCTPPSCCAALSLRDGCVALDDRMRLRAPGSELVQEHVEVVRERTRRQGRRLKDAARSYHTAARTTRQKGALVLRVLGVLLACPGSWGKATTQLLSLTRSPRKKGDSKPTKFNFCLVQAREVKRHWHAALEAGSTRVLVRPAHGTRRLTRVPRRHLAVSLAE